MPRHALGTALRSFCLSFGDLCGLFGAPWAVLGHTLGHLGLHQDVLGASRDSIGDFASTGDPFASRGLSSTAPAHKNRGGVPSSVTSGRSGAEQGYILIRNKDLGLGSGFG